ncbi:MAG: TonB family protein [Oleiphilaceae bacterium]|nr:TonB family protein [Oleiphilaceae bacterium]
MSLIVNHGVGAGDRLCFTLFLALAMHAVIVLSDFIPDDPKPAAKTMEITLSRIDDVVERDKADFLAATNQIGSGSEEQKQQLTTPTPLPEMLPGEQAAAAPPPAKPKQTEKKQSYVTSTQSERKRPSLFERAQVKRESEANTPQQSILERSLEIAALEARLDNQLQSYARRPRVTRLTAADTMKAIDARYVEAVVAKIERVGRQYFPMDNNRKLYGKLRVLISIYADGSIRDIKILESSGNLVLDAKTHDIIRRAADFAPFPKEVRKERDVIDLIRTFSYQPSGVSSF